MDRRVCSHDVEVEPGASGNLDLSAEKAAGRVLGNDEEAGAGVKEAIAADQARGEDYIGLGRGAAVPVVVHADAANVVVVLEAASLGTEVVGNAGSRALGELLALCEGEVGACDDGRVWVGHILQLALALLGGDGERNGHVVEGAVAGALNVHGLEELEGVEGLRRCRHASAVGNGLDGQDTTSKHDGVFVGLCMSLQKTGSRQLGLDGS